MAKYIIEVEDEPSMYEDGFAFYKCVDVPHWYIPDMRINRLKPYEDAERNTGHWEEHIFDGIMGARPRALMCTKCNVISTYAYNFCPHCGAKMEVKE